MQCLLPPPGAAGDRLPDATAATGAAAPHSVGRPRPLAKLPHDGPVARPAVLGHGVAPAGRPGGRRPVRPAGQHAAQSRGESLLRLSLWMASGGIQRTWGGFDFSHHIFTKTTLADAFDQLRFFP